MLAREPSAVIPPSLKSSWLHLDEKTVMNRVYDLKMNSNLIDQGSLGLCGEAAFFHHVLQRRPLLFGSMAKMLFMHGVGFVGDLVIRPDDDLLEADYAQIAADTNTSSSSLPPQADWMVLSSLRDTENEFLDFQGSPTEDKAESSNIMERSWWYMKSKLYTKVERDGNTNLAHIKSKITKNANTHIGMRIKGAMIRPGAVGNHVISLESPLIIDETHDKVRFDYWTWGHASFDDTAQLNNNAGLTVAQFHNNYLGAIIAEF